MKNDNFKSLLDQCKQVNALQVRIIEMEAEKRKGRGLDKTFPKGS